LVFRIAVKQAFYFIKHVKELPRKKNYGFGISDHSVAIAGAILDNEKFTLRNGVFNQKK
jgi:hypothetical protein